MNIVDKNNEKIETYREQFYAALGDYKNAYILHKKNPNNNEYERLYTISSAQVDSIDKNVFIFSIKMDKDLEKLNSYVSEMDKNIKQKKEINNDLKSKLLHIEGNGNGAIIMNENSKELYKYQYVANWTVFLGIFLISYSLYHVFKNNNNPMGK
jgi:hypothetical protein